MDKQLEWITNIMNKSNIRYWLDSGTLLGMVRDDKIIENDNDIDLSIWDTDTNLALSIISEIRKENYRIRMLYYEGNIFKMKCIPNDKSKKLIDINIFRRSNNGFAWCPQSVDIAIEPIFYRLFSSVLIFFWQNIAKKVNIDKSPWNRITNHYTWWIPITNFEEITKLKKSNLFVPVNYLAYLNFRYGNWQIPNPNWDFITDDNGLRNQAPKELISKI